ncbi:hypothetical protein TRFO_32350 [Tritrichomonas foetus]|uniref:K Homology domain-containing protein n=1 Tax=Tritrichomonas foetus TaxID=1144522 RepID=A0A1J4JUE4_9EUKA|nr:hypothetical protein TRFO_32350 [Tritrichomonas foetus]|eukprot:OHT00877.1 hypothetical protein TRFO_32350 [Tritrichomonas foetus]
MFGFGIPILTPSVPRTKKSKWDKTTLKTVIPNVACILPPDLSPDILHTYLLRFQLEEVEYKINHLEEEHPNVLYGENLLTNFTQDNKLQLTPDVRARDSLVSERRQIIASIEKIFPAFRAPLSILLSLQKSIKKINFTEENHFVIILGPRANTLRALEKEFNVRMSIRGPKKNSDNPNEVTDFGHVLIIGNNDDEVGRCASKVELLIKSDENYDDFNHDVDVNSYSLSFDPAVETVPWEDVQPTNYEFSTDRYVNAVDDLIKEINNNDKLAEDDETPERRALFERFAVDLSRRDISCLLREAPPPGLA